MNVVTDILSIYIALWTSNSKVGWVVDQDKTKTNHAVAIIVNSASWKTRDSYLFAVRESLWQLLDWKGLGTTSPDNLLQRSYQPAFKITLYS